MIVFSALVPELDWQLAHEKIGVRWVEDTTGIVAVDRKTKEVRAIVIFQFWSYSSVQVHMWIDTPMVIRSGLFKEVANYVFNTCGREVMIGLVPADNAAALKLNKHVGFREVYRVRNGFNIGIDYVIMEADRASLARWLPEEGESGIKEYPEAPRLHWSREGTGSGVGGHQPRADVG